MSKLTFEEFENLKQENKFEAKQYLIRLWGTDKFIAYIDKVKIEEENNEYVCNPFTGNKIDKCYIFKQKKHARK